MTDKKMVRFAVPSGVGEGTGRRQVKTTKDKEV